MQRITTRISRHQLVSDVPLDDLNNGQLNGEEWQITNKSQLFHSTFRDAAGLLQRLNLKHRYSRQLISDLIGDLTRIKCLCLCSRAVPTSE